MPKYQKKLGKLIALGKEIASEKLSQERDFNYMDLHGIGMDETLEDMIEPEQYYGLSEKILKWQIQCKHLLHQLPIQNTIYDNDLLKLLRNRDYFKGVDVQKITILLESLLEDYQDGLFDNIILTIEGQSSLQYLDQANEFFDSEYYGAAGLIAISALEGFLKKISESISQEEEQKGKKQEGLERINNYLKTRGIIDKPTNKKIKEWTALRNNFAHGNLDINRETVKDLILGIREFISARIQNLSEVN
jgi:uncharacterized protein YutE (UPF0331/DUF86 family)